MRILVGAAFCAVLALAACSSSGAAPTPEPAPTSNVTVSDKVPSMDELREMGLSDVQAECFVTTIDPEGTGRVTSVELFVEAFGECM